MNRHLMSEALWFTEKKSEIILKDLNQQSLEWFNIKNYSTNMTLVMKGDKLELSQCSKIILNKNM